jgi:VanZ family protein
VALYNVALSAERIEHVYAAALSRNELTRPAATGGLVALYKFTERSGSTIVDSSPRPPILLTIPKRVERVRAFLSRDSQLLSWPSSLYGLIDGVVNLLIFVPFGLLGCTVLAARSWTFQQAIGITIAAAALLSFMAESIQYFLVSRTSQLEDLILNVVSAGLGGALYWAIRRLREAA